MPRKGQLKESIVGNKFGLLTVITNTQTYKNKKLILECLCECGNLTNVVISSLKSGDTKSCGCLLKTRLDITGLIVGDLKALRYICESKSGSSIWEFECSCGTRLQKVGANVKYGNTMSHCGCKSLKPSESAYNALYGKYKYSANKRNIEFNISKSDFKILTKENCYYCNSFPFSSIKGPLYRQEYIYNGIDRVNNLLGYSINNCVACCKVCNVAKAMFTEQYFYEWVKNISENLKNKGKI